MTMAQQQNKQEDGLCLVEEEPGIASNAGTSDTGTPRSHDVNVFHASISTMLKYCADPVT
jgi:hypothetical protein